MASILVVTGSVRPNSVNSKIVPVVVGALEAKEVEVTVADLGGLELPFFNSEFIPADPNFVPLDEGVRRWTDMVASADGVVFVTPEYNHTLSPIQLNAIDWIANEWKDKAVALVGYGWGTGGGQAHDAAREALASVLKAKVGESQTNLFFTKDIDPEGALLDKESVDSKLDATLSELLATIEG